MPCTAPFLSSLCLLGHILFRCFQVDSLEGAPTRVPKFQEVLERAMSLPSVFPWLLQGSSASQLSSQTTHRKKGRPNQSSGTWGQGPHGASLGAWPSALHPVWLMASRLSALRETAFWTSCACPSPGTLQALPATGSQHLEQCLAQSSLSINICGIDGKNRSAEEGQRAEGSVPASLDPGS